MSSASNVFSGYKLVESFGPDEEYEDEVEECYVTLDLGSVEPTLVPSSSSFRVAGLETDTPFLQLSGTVMKGQHQTLLGTELVFRDNSEDDSANVSPSFVQHIANTEHRIKFRAVELTPKADQQEARVIVDPRAQQQWQGELVSHADGVHNDKDVGDTDVNVQSIGSNKGKGVERGDRRAEMEDVTRMDVDE